jgi:hypothetical protein
MLLVAVLIAVTLSGREQRDPAPTSTGENLQADHAQVFISRERVML